MKRKEKAPVEKMTREQIIESVQPLPLETKIKAWLMQIDEKFYHICAYGGVYRVAPKVSIWESNKKGKRISNDPIFTMAGSNQGKCVEMFLDTIEAEQARIKAEAEEAILNEELRIEKERQEAETLRIEAEQKAEAEAKINAELDEEMKLLAEIEAEEKQNSEK